MFGLILKLLLNYYCKTIKNHKYADHQNNGKSVYWPSYN